MNLLVSESQNTEVPRKKKSGPSPQQWHAFKDIIHDLYIEQSKTCDEVRQYMIEKYDFTATRRMYKTRFGIWNFPTKKKKREDYLAMQAVAQHRKARGMDTFFEVKKGKDRILRTAEQINKELNRPGDNTPMDLDTAKRILRENEITLVPNPFTNSSCSQPQSANLSQANVRERSLEDMALEYSSGDGEEFSDISDHGEAFSANYNESNRSPAILYGQQPEQLCTPPLPSILDLPISTWSAGDNEDFSTMDWDACVGNPPSYDFFDMFMKLQADSLYYTAGHELPPEFGYVDRAGFSDLTPDQQKFKTGEWAAPFYLSCESGRTSPNFELCKRRAMSIFKHMILSNTENDFIFPCLNWMAIVLTCNGHVEHLKEFLHESCKTIDESGQYSTYGGLFHYAYAVYQGNERDIKRYGASLISYKDAHCIPESPNAIVSRCYWAWHQLLERQYDAAIQILEIYLPISVRVMGDNDLITINCLVILSRAYADQGQLQLGVERLKEAIDRLGNPKRPMQAFRITLLDRLAQYYLQQRNYAEAELLFRQVVHGRIEFLGWKNGETWSAINDLCETMRAQGNVVGANQLYAELYQQYTAHFHQTL